MQKTHARPKSGGYITLSPTVETLLVNTPGESRGSVRNKIQEKSAGPPSFPPFLIGGPDKTKYYCQPYISSRYIGKSFYMCKSNVGF
ncbi:hypothetical protein NPIL_535541 [Nephila pilipes]|uniref:Uncharacterized protein n=1 Tax=Nephila pilipes TaxID=299642 RepID=A0A8X6TID7_NEPPI|nr:hypothetical protein NPIL_535541 [Nephila pilipes]